MKKIFFTIITLLIVSITSCDEEKIGQTPTDNIPPQPISNVSVESLPGGAKISYELPQETDISYVKGEYLFQGERRITRASVYNNYMIIEGLGNTNPVDITLYTVDHSENTSTPVKASFTPGIPPIHDIFTSMGLKADFGGINITWDNENKVEIGFTIYATNEKGIFEGGETFYTNQKDGSYSFRGYDSSERIFAFTITDKWGNISDTLKAAFTPLFEKELDKSKHKREVLPVDNNTDYNSGWLFSNLFDGVVGNNGWHTKQNDPNQKIPLYFTIDLGVEATLSRFKLWHRLGNNVYKNHNIKTFEVWGSRNYKKGMQENYWSEEWKNDWELLGDYETFKPSGEDNPSVTNEDIAYAEAGFEFMVPIEKQRVRYVRFAMKSNWSGSNALHISEITFYGDDRINDINE